MTVAPAALSPVASRLVATEIAHAEECLGVALLGWQVREARRAKGLAQRQLAMVACVSPKTLRLIENGDPGVRPDSRHRVLTQLPASTHGASKSLLREHHVQDIQSLLLHRVAVRLILAHPPLAHKALQTVCKWLSDNPDSRTVPLWLQWQTFLEARAVEGGGRGVRRDWNKVFAIKWQQMRQASPLPTVLPPEVRTAVLEVVRDWKHKLGN